VQTEHLFVLKVRGLPIYGQGVYIGRYMAYQHSLRVPMYWRSYLFW